MAEIDRTEFRILYWDAIHQSLTEQLSADLDGDKTDILKRVVVRLALEGQAKDAEEFPLWDARPLLEDLADQIHEDDAPLDATMLNELVGSLGEPLVDQIAMGFVDDKAYGELETYAEPISKDDIASFDALRAAIDLADDVEDGATAEDEESEEVEAVEAEADEGDEADGAAEDSYDAGEDAELDVPEGMAAPDDLLGDMAAEGGMDDLMDMGAQMDELLPGLDAMLEEGASDGEIDLLSMPPEMMDELLPEGVDVPASESAIEEDPEGEDDGMDAAVLAELENMDLSQIDPDNIGDVLSKAGIESPYADEAIAAAEGAEEVAVESADAPDTRDPSETLGGFDEDFELSDADLEGLEAELEGAEALAVHEKAEEIIEAEIATPQDRVRARMLQISEAVEELSENHDDRQIVQQLIEHFRYINRPIIRMGYRTFGSLSDALVETLEFIRDNEISTPPALTNNLRELVTTLAEVVEGRWSKYKTFYWLINKLNSTMRQMEEMVEEREEQRFFGAFGISTEDEDDIEDQIAAKREEQADRQRVELTELQEIFIQEANEHIDLLNRNLLLSERHPEDQETIYALMRSAHSIKGSANISKFPRIAELGHAMEDVMVAIRDNELSMTPAIIDIMLASVDQLQGLLANVEYDEDVNEEPIEELKKKLRALAEELQAHPDRYKATARDIDAELEKKVGLKVERQVAEKDQLTEAERQQNTVRVDYENLNLLLNQAAELVINRTRLSGQIEAMRGMIEGLNSEKKKLRGTEVRLDRTIEEVSQEMGNFFNSEAALTGSSGGGGAAKEASSALVTRLQHVRSAMSRLLRIRESGMLVEFSDAEFDRFSELDIIWRDLRESVTHIDDVIDQLELLSTTLDQNISRISLIANDLHEQIMRIRMLPVSRIFNRFPRTVRDMSRQLDKKIELRMAGENTPLDKTIIEDLADPMIHLVRNACDHGIETSSEREEMGKDETGTIWLDARQEGNQVVIEIRDDGKGIDLEAVKNKAIERGVMSTTAAERASEQELINLIFAPGFSTAAKTTDISGRGVGMDVVRTAITKLKGSVSVSSELGEGTTFTIRLPLTLAISQALLFSASSARMAIQLSAVDETIMVRDDAIMHTMGTEIIKLRDEILPVVRLEQVLGLGSAEESEGERPVIIVNTGNNRRVGVVVDRLIGREEIVVKNLGDHLKNVRYVSGGTILGDGAVTLILDIAAIVDEAKPVQAGDVRLSADDGSGGSFDMQRYEDAIAGVREKVADADLSSDRLEAVSDDAPSEPSAPSGGGVPDGMTPHILVTDDSISIRRFVGSILENAGYRVTLANDGVDAMEKLKGAGRFDLILTDLEMPRMHGYELIAEVKQNIAYKNIPIIILTGRAGEKHSRKGMELGAAAFLVKPFNEDELLGEITKNIERTPAG